jgi:hypothetical protein
METLQLDKQAVDYCAKLFPQYNRPELERRILLGRQVYKDKLSEPGVENPLTPEELGLFGVFQYYKLWTEATDEERAAIPEDVQLEEGAIDQEFEEMVGRLNAGEFDQDEEEELPD